MSTGTNAFDIGFIGVGSVGASVVNAVSRVGSRIVVADKNIERAEEIATKIGATVADAKTVVQSSKYIFIGVTGDDMEDLMSDVSAIFNTRTDTFVIVSMVSGFSVEYITYMLGRPYPVIRLVPSPACKIGSGIILYSVSEEVHQDDVANLLEYMKFSGYLHEVSEKQIDGVSAIATCGPVIAYMLLDVLSDTGAFLGMNKKQALQYSYEMLIGSARMVEATDESPGVLKDEICRIGEAPTEVLRKLYEGRFNSAVMEAVIAGYEAIKKNNRAY